MRNPSFRLLTTPSIEEECRSSYAQSMHPDPRFYKYIWWVFWEESPVDGAEFLEDAYAINTATAMALMEDLLQKRKPHWIYNRQIPRLDPGVTPFDPSHLRWKDTRFAPPLSEDSDAEWQGHR
jgi:hypothetical protein